MGRCPWTLECTGSQSGSALCNTPLQGVEVVPWGKVPCCGGTEGLDPASGCVEQPASWSYGGRGVGVDEELEASWRACEGRAEHGLMLEEAVVVA